MPNENFKSTIHVQNNINLQVLPVSPASTNVPLQMVCFFDQTKNQTYAGGTLAIDEHFSGKIRKLRSSNQFLGLRLETLLLTPQNKEIGASKLLMIGLGDPATFVAETLEQIGHLAVFEAIKLNVQSFAFAPSIKDAGISDISASEAARNLSLGMKRAIKAAKSLEAENLIPPIQLQEIYMLAGAAHAESALSGLQQAMQ